MRNKTVFPIHCTENKFVIYISYLFRSQSFEKLEAPMSSLFWNWRWSGQWLPPVHTRQKKSEVPIKMTVMNAIFLSGSKMKLFWTINDFIYLQNIIFIQTFIGVMECFTNTLSIQVLAVTYRSQEILINITYNSHVLTHCLIMAFQHFFKFWLEHLNVTFITKVSSAHMSGFQI